MLSSASSHTKAVKTPSEISFELEKLNVITLTQLIFIDFKMMNYFSCNITCRTMCIHSFKECLHDGLYVCFFNHQN